MIQQCFVMDLSVFVASSGFFLLSPTRICITHNSALISYKCTFISIVSATFI